uniref:Cyclin N-terminal domain-containing protein n=1 Tax=Anopheles atroparvus TaxID=41427 RepID=A0A240PJV5_ANOAO
MYASNNIHLSCTEYDSDILETLKERESLRWNVRIPMAQVVNRSSMVALIRNIAEQYSFQRTSVHLAIYLSDVFLKHNRIVEERLNLVALTCFYIACKIEENEPKVPSPKRLCSFVENAYTPRDFIALEVVILNFFKWQVTVPTAATFLDFFALHSLQMDDVGNPADANFAEALFKHQKEIIKSSLVYLDLSLSYYRMSNLKPSLLAAACVAAARTGTNNMRAWNEHLTCVTGYSYEQLADICSTLVFELMPMVVAHASPVLSRKRSIADSGYLSALEDSDDSEDVYSSRSSDDGDSTISSRSCSSAERSKRRRHTSSSASSSEPGETCAKRQKVSYNLM